MPSYGADGERYGARRQVGLAVGIMVLALATPYVSEGLQQQVAFTLQASVLRPFIATQRGLTEASANAEQIDRLQAELDSLAGLVATQAALADENRTLRQLLGLAERAGPEFLPATILRPGTPGSESSFIVDLGSDHGLREGAPVLTARGLVGRITQVRSRSALGMDWTHPDFRASAMVADGSTFGIVENVRGEFREQDRLRLNGTAYYQTVSEGARVVTSGLGGVFPRGIPIGTVEATAEVQGTWLKSYWLRPAAEPGSVTHVLVETVDGPSDLSALWQTDAPAPQTPPVALETPRVAPPTPPADPEAPPGGPGR